MPIATASDNLAKTKRKRTEENIDELPAGLEDRNDSAQDKPKQADEQAPSQKRQRAATPETHVEPEQAQQESLPRLLSIPHELFVEISSYLLPIDIIYLSRSNKRLQSMLMSRSSISIWRNSMKNVEDIPPCPPGVSEPCYLTFLFINECSLCGEKAKTVDTNIVVRLCAPCRRVYIMPVDYGVQHLACLIPTRKRSSYALGRDFLRILAQYQEKMRDSDCDALTTWIGKKKAEVAEREKLAPVIQRFLVIRENEIVDARYNEILCRLDAMGWSRKDFTWIELLPQLITLLEANSEERLIAERKVRKQQRRQGLRYLYFGMRANLGYDSATLNPDHPAHGLSNPTPSYPGPYPGFEEMLKWPIIKELYEADITREAMEASFEEHREEIELLIIQWKNRIYASFMNLLRDSPKAQGLTSDSNSAASQVDSDPDLLFRADSLFYVITARVKRPMSYDTVLAEVGATWKPEMSMPEPVFESIFGPATGSISRLEPISKTFDMNHIARYPQAQQVAMELLKSLGKPDALYREIQGMKRVYCCGRCDNTAYMTWEQLVQHYIEEKQLFNTLTRCPPSRSHRPAIYENVHSSAFQTDRPLVKTRFTGYRNAAGAPTSNPATSSERDAASDIQFTPITSSLATGLHTYTLAMLFCELILFSLLPLALAYPSKYNMDYASQEDKIHKVKSAMLASIRTSWEQGVAVDALTELDFPEYTVYAFSGNITRHTTHPPRDPDNRRLPLQVVQFALSAAARQSPDGRLSQMIGDGRGHATLDGASAGMAMLTGKYLNNSYSAYLSQAARTELNYILNTAPRTSTGAISHRTSSKENWADAVYMGFPFIASYGTATFNQTLLQLAYDQCHLHRNVLRVPEAGMWAHIWSDDKKAFKDKGLWATGNAWAAKGMLNVAILIDKSSKNMTTQVSDLKGWVQEILNGTFARLDSDGLVPNYMDNARRPGANDTFGDAAASALLAATAYRAASSWPADFGSSYIDNAEKIKESVMAKINDLGVLSPVVNPVSRREKGILSTEAQAFGIMMYAAWKDWADSVKAGHINVNRIRRFGRDTPFGHGGPF